jgi:hypothetical protein
MGRAIRNLVNNILYALKQNIEFSYSGQRASVLALIGLMNPQSTVAQKTDGGFGDYAFAGQGQRNSIRH